MVPTTEKLIIEGLDNSGKPRQPYADKLSKMEEPELFKETKDKIWLSAYASNNSRSDYHWQCDATYDEWYRRGRGERYDEAWKAVAG